MHECTNSGQWGLSNRNQIPAFLELGILVEGGDRKEIPKIHQVASGVKKVMGALFCNRACNGILGSCWKECNTSVCT